MPRVLGIIAGLFFLVSSSHAELRQGTISADNIRSGTLGPGISIPHSQVTGITSGQHHDKTVDAGDIVSGVLATGIVIPENIASGTLGTGILASNINCGASDEVLLFGGACVSTTTFGGGAITTSLPLSGTGTGGDPATILETSTVTVEAVLVKRIGINKTSPVASADSVGPIAFLGTGSSAVTLDTDLTNAVGNTIHYVGIGNPAAGASMALVGNTANTSPPIIALLKTRSSGSSTADTIVVNGDFLGIIDFYGADGAAFRRGASIKSKVRGTPGLVDMPADLAFFTTADGSANPVLGLSISSSSLVTMEGDTYIKGDLIVDGSFLGNALTADALSMTPILCGSGDLALGIIDDGGAVCATSATGPISGSTSAITAGALFTHEADAGAHHDKTTSADEIVSGTLGTGIVIPENIAAGTLATGVEIGAEQITSGTLGTGVILPVSHSTFTTIQTARSTTNTAFDTVSGSTLTLPMNGGRALIGFTCQAGGNVTTDRVAMGIIVNGDFIDGQSQATGTANGGLWRQREDAGGNDDGMSMTHLTQQTFTGNTTFALIFTTESGTFTLNAGGNTNCQFYVTEI